MNLNISNVMFPVCLCMRMSCLPLGIVLFRTTDETYGESKPSKFHNITFMQVNESIELI